MADEAPDRYSAREYEKYAPQEYSSLAVARWFGLVAGLLFFGILAMSMFNASGPGDAVGLFVLFWLVGAGFGIAQYKLRQAADDKVAAALMSERSSMRAEVETVAKDLKGIAENIGNIRSAGHVVLAGQGATVLIDSQVTNSFNTIKSQDPVLADAIQTITGAIEKSGNKDAGQAWGRFLKELSGERDKSVMHALWDRVVKLVPDVVSLVESVAKLTALFV